jgi:hypothetical protein
MSHNGRHRKTLPQPGRLQRRSLLLGGGVLAAGTAFGVIPYVGSFSAERAAVLGGDSARTDPNRTSRGSAGRPPRVYTTEEWGADKPEDEPAVLRRPPRYLVVHHTFTRNFTDLSVAHGFWLSRAIQKAHKGRGWIDTGQHFTISRGGHVMEGRTGSLNATLKGDMVVGTHVRRANDYTVGIECEGIYNSVLPPRRLVSSLVQMLAWLCTRYDLDPRTAIVPHMKFNDTDCCGYRFAPTLPQVRSEVAKALSAVPAR